MRTFKIPRIFITLILHSLKYYPGKKIHDIGLPDGDGTNFKYTSSRSKIKYLYLRTPLAMMTNYFLMRYLKRQTGIDFRSSINTKCLPLNFYNSGDSILIHRDRNMHTGEPIKYVLIITLKQEGSALFKLYSNVDVSNSGKTVDIEDAKIDAIRTKQGTALWFDNTDTAHDLTVIDGERISLTYRSK